MSVQVTIGGDRLRAGSKMRTQLHGYGWSSHNLGYTWRSSQNYGTVVPFFKQVGLKGDTWHISTTTMLRTLPTPGPLFGSFKGQIDFFFCPFRLNIGALHNNRNGIANKMGEVKMPSLVLQPWTDWDKEDVNESQIASDSLAAYLGIRGVGAWTGSENPNSNIYRAFNFAPFLDYYDCVKNFYINKQEETFATVGLLESTLAPSIVMVRSNTGEYKAIPLAPTEEPIAIAPISNQYGDIVRIRIQFTNGKEPTVQMIEDARILKNISINVANKLQNKNLTKTLDDFKWGNGQVEYFKDGMFGAVSAMEVSISASLILSSLEESEKAYIRNYSLVNKVIQQPRTRAGIVYRPIEELDEMREKILNLSQIGQRVIADPENKQQLPDTYASLAKATGGKNNLSYSQYGLALKCYQSDIFNNWLRKEWVDEILEKTTLDATNGISIDAIAMTHKLWEYMNRNAISGNTYQDWEEATTGTDIQRFCESPIFMGGMSFDVVFDEIVSTAAASVDGQQQPLGTLGGRGNITNVKGGNVTIKCKEYGYIIGLVSFTPRIDYYQGNDFDMYSIESMEDLYKPAFAGIGFQDLIQEQMAWWTTEITGANAIVQQSAGKQPSWLNYQTNFNKVYGDFARSSNAGFMVITRNYKKDYAKMNQGAGKITDLTTSIDPRDYAYLFSSGDLESQPLWVQIKVDAEVRRIMSANIMPNL